MNAYRTIRSSVMVFGALLTVGVMLLWTGCNRDPKTEPAEQHVHAPGEAHDHEHADQPAATPIQDHGHAQDEHDHDGPDHAGHNHETTGGDDHDHDHGAGETCNEDHADAETAAEAAEHGTAIDLSPAVVANLGITFVEVEHRPVDGTIRLPGRFELRPEARREYHVMMPGRVELLVKQYQQIKAGDPLYRLDSPQWQQMQSDLVDLYNAMRRSHAELAVAEASQREIQQGVEFLEQRIAKLAEAQVRRMELEAELAEKRNTLPRLQAELDAARLAFEAAHTRYDVMLGTAASLTGIDRDTLDPLGAGHEHLNGTTPEWRSITRLTVHAEADGIIDRVAMTNRGWAETGDLVLDTVEPTALRFHADALQTDINRFATGMPARVCPPLGGSIDVQDTVDGWIHLGFRAHPEQRTVPVYLDPERIPSWAKAGVTAYLDVFVEGTDRPVLAIPRSCIVRDGLDLVVFRRDRHDPDRVFRVTAEVGATDGRWIEIKRGVSAGDEVVLDGAYTLVLASSKSGQDRQGGHFHGDGTFHTGDTH